MVSVERPEPPEEAKFNTESKGDVTPEVDELSSGNEAHANFFGVFLFGNMATPNYPTVGDRPVPGTPEFETLRTQAVVIQRLQKKLCQIKVLRQRVKQGCELDAAQHKTLRREAEVRATLETARTAVFTRVWPLSAATFAPAAATAVRRSGADRATQSTRGAVSSRAAAAAAARRCNAVRAREPA